MNVVLLNEWVKFALQVSSALLFLVALLGLFRYKTAYVFLANEKGEIFGSCRVRCNRFTGTLSAMEEKEERLYVKVNTAPFEAKILRDIDQAGNLVIVLGVVYTSELLSASVYRLVHPEDNPMIHDPWRTLQ